jgi:hypothetical protein
MRIAEIFELGYGGGWDDYDHDDYKHHKRRKHKHYRHYDDDDSLINLDIDL